MSDVLHIVGPPGTGKTYTLVEAVRELLSDGLPPERIGVCSYTTAAANEASERIAEGLKVDDQPYWGTMHSIGYKHLLRNGFRRVIRHGDKAWVEFCEQHGLDTSQERVDAEEVWEQDKIGDLLLAVYDFRRQNLMSREAVRSYLVRTQFIEANLPYEDEQEWFEEQYEQYKRDHGLVDFTDMLLLPYRERWRPPIDVLIVDECQDLVPLQSQIVKSWMPGRTILAYDDDQAIYAFQGARPLWLLGLPGQVRVLDKSRRVPQVIAHLAQQLIRRVRQRREKTWVARKPGGVIVHATLDDIPHLIDRYDGTWFLLARNRMFLDDIRRVLIDAGIPYRSLSRGVWSPIRLFDDGCLMAVLSLSMGKPILPNEARALAKSRPKLFLPLAETSLRHRTEPLYRDDMLRIVNDDGRELLSDNIYRAVRRYGLYDRDASFVSRLVSRKNWLSEIESPRVTIGTIHGSKGREADNVAILPDMTRKTYLSYEQSPDDELRVWYVALTRARERLILLESSRGRYRFEHI